MSQVIDTAERAKAWVTDNLDVSRETIEMLDEFETVLLEEAKLQNLISPSTLGDIWVRHIMDSAQLVSLALKDKRSFEGLSWLDLGTGAGFPGLIVAMLTDANVTMVESRTRRAEYLQRMIDRFSLENAVVKGCRLEKLDSFPADIISARAFAPLEKLLGMAERFSTEKTVWLLPKGKNATNELEGLAKNWTHMFHVKQSLTDENAGIIAGNLA